MRDLHTVEGFSYKEEQETPESMGIGRFLGITDKTSTCASRPKEGFS
jgi:hypothetical protein